MNEFTLSPEGRRRLWQCYTLLFRLADAAEESNATDSELCEDQGSTAGSAAKKLTDGMAEIEVSEVSEDEKLSEVEA
jgi:hypothetical protein